MDPFWRSSLNVSGDFGPEVVNVPPSLSTLSIPWYSLVFVGTQVEGDNFNLNGITETDYAAGCDQIAPAFAAVPGLVTKVWLADSDAGVYGGVCTELAWRYGGLPPDGFTVAAALAESYDAHPDEMGQSSA